MRLILAAAVAATLLLCSSAQARVPCAKGCTYNLHVGSTARQWQTPWKAPDDGSTNVVITVGGHRLETDLVGDSLPGCAMRFYGQGVLVRVSACADGATPIHFRVVTVNNHPVRARVWIKQGWRQDVR